MKTLVFNNPKRALVFLSISENYFFKWVSYFFFYNNKDPWYKIENLQLLEKEESLFFIFFVQNELCWPEPFKWKPFMQNEEALKLI